MNTLTNQIYKNLQAIPSVANSIDSEDCIRIKQMDKSTVWCTVLRFGKYTEMFSVSLTTTGKVKKNSVRFYE